MAEVSHFDVISSLETSSCLPLGVVTGDFGLSFLLDGETDDIC